jgi:hypothetical protein
MALFPGAPLISLLRAHARAAGTPGDTCTAGLWSCPHPGPPPPTWTKTILRTGFGPSCHGPPGTLVVTLVGWGSTLFSLPGTRPASRARRPRPHRDSAQPDQAVRRHSRAWLSPRSHGANLPHNERHLAHHPSREWARLCVQTLTLRTFIEQYRESSISSLDPNQPLCGERSYETINSENPPSIRHHNRARLENIGSCLLCRHSNTRSSAMKF